MNHDMMRCCCMMGGRVVEDMMRSRVVEDMMGSRRVMHKR